MLAEIGAARTGEMREVVATIQAEQDLVIRAPLDQCLVVQGGPGTGKTAVGLHRAAFLLFEHRRRLVRDGVLVVVAKNDRKIRIEVAKALEGAIADLAAKRIISELITPRFKANDFAGGLEAGTEQLMKLIAGEALPALRPPSC